MNGLNIYSKTVLVSAVVGVLSVTAINSEASCVSRFHQCRDAAHDQREECEEEARAQARDSEQERRNERDACTDTPQECNRAYYEAKAEIEQQLTWEMGYCSNQYNSEINGCWNELYTCS